MVECSGSGAINLELRQVNGLPCAKKSLTYGNVYTMFSNISVDFLISVPCFLCVKQLVVNQCN